MFRASSRRYRNKQLSAGPRSPHAPPRPICVPAVKLDYAYPDQPAGTFTDVLQLKLVNDAALQDIAWRIDDITLSGGTMRSRLIDAFKP